MTKNKTTVIALLFLAWSLLVLTVAMLVWNAPKAHAANHLPPACEAPVFSGGSFASYFNHEDASPDSIEFYEKINDGYPAIMWLEPHGSTPQSYWTLVIMVFNYDGQSNATEGVQWGSLASGQTHMVSRTTSVNGWATKQETVRKDTGYLFDPAGSRFGWSRAFWSTSPGIQGYGGAAECMYTYQNIYNNTGNPLPSGYMTFNQKDNQIPEAPSGWNVFDFLSSIWQAVINLPQTIINGIQELFVPDSSTLEIQYNDMLTFFDEKFGFIAYPFVFISNFLSEVADNVEVGNFWICASTGVGHGGWAYSFGNFFGQEYHINQCALENAFGHSFVDWVRLAVQAATLFILIGALYRKYKEVIAK